MQGTVAAADTDHTEVPQHLITIPDITPGVVDMVRKKSWKNN